MSQTPPTDLSAIADLVARGRCERCGVKMTQGHGRNEQPWCHWTGASVSEIDPDQCTACAQDTIRACERYHESRTP